MEWCLLRTPRLMLVLLLWACGLVAPVRAEETPRKFYAEDIKAAMMAHIAARADANGVFHLRDEKTGEELALKFVTIHDPVRVIDRNTYFACTDFAVAGAPEKLYDLDFWMKSLLYGWYKHPRYTFVKDRVVELY